MEIRGASAFHAALASRMLEARAVTDLAVKAAAEQVQRDVVDNLMLREHPKGTPTPSAPGEPPAMILGGLKASVIVTPPTAVGPYRFEARVGPTAVYSRIQELGGTAGRGAKLPPRPYLKPAVEAVRPKLTALFWSMWAGLGRGLRG